MESIADKFISWPSAPFFLRHVVHINYGGKVYSVLRGIEAAVETTNEYERILLICYAIFMTLGMYWYTRFWDLPEDITEYYKEKEESTHVLPRTVIGSLGVTLGAAMYYFLFTVLFTWSYSYTYLPTSLALALWNFWCTTNLLLATPCYREGKET